MPDEVTAPAEEAQETTSAVEETQTAAESETASTEKKEGEPESKPKGGFQKRIDRLTKRNYDLEAKLDRQSEQVQQLLDRLEGKSSATVKEAAEAEPKPEQFNTYEQFVKAQARWEARQELKVALDQRKAEESRKSEQQRQHEAFDEYNKRTAQARSEYDDWDEVVGGSALVVPEAAQLAIVELENGPDIVYHLATHPDECNKLGTMSAARAIAEVGRLSAQLAKSQASEEGAEEPSAPTKPPVSSAPPPIKPVRKPAPTDKGLHDDLAVDEWMKRREAQAKG